MEDPSSTSSPERACVKVVLNQILDRYFNSPVPTPDYPPISSIPRTSPERLQRATPKEAPLEHVASASPTAKDYLYDHTSSSPTVLYLAYGSNLCAKTFLGQRGIRPISAVNVSVPSLRLTFDLPGFPYNEPCFANSAPRKLPKVPKHPGLPPGLDPPPVLFPPWQALAGSETKPKINAHGDPEWDKGLIGVVYEVTPEDYAAIIRTEGSSYQDVLCPCFPIPQRVGVPEKPPFPELPRPFLAHTLYAPRIPTKPGDGDDHGLGGRDGDDDGDAKGPLDRLKDWWRKKLLQPIRPDPEYAQPSARYLKLIVDGAAEHELPDDYQQWLASLQPYTTTTRRQTIGQYLLFVLMVPIIILSLVVNKLLADDGGKSPVWLGLLLEMFIRLIWTAYDRVFLPVLGDGERTEDQEDKERRCGARRVLRKRHSPDVGDVEEKLGLLDGRNA